VASVVIAKNVMHACDLHVVNAINMMNVMNVMKVMNARHMVNVWNVMVVIVLTYQGWRADVGAAVGGAK
jgi:hypothetical protein